MRAMAERPAQSPSQRAEAPIPKPVMAPTPVMTVFRRIRDKSNGSVLFEELPSGICTVRLESCRYFDSPCPGDSPMFALNNARTMPGWYRLLAAMVAIVMLSLAPACLAQDEEETRAPIPDTKAGHELKWVLEVL